MIQHVLFAHRATLFLKIAPVVLKLVTLISSLMMDLYVLIVVNAQVVMQTMINVCLILLLLRIMGHCFQQELVRIRLNLLMETLGVESIMFISQMSSNLDSLTVIITLKLSLTMCTIPSIQLLSFYVQAMMIIDDETFKVNL